MALCILAAISHQGNESGFMDPSSKAAFRRCIAPLLTPSSVVLSEGYYAEGLIRPGSKEYDSFLRIYGESLSGQHPLFAAVDPRFTRNAAKQRRQDAMDRAWERFVMLGVTIEHDVSSHEEVLELIKSKNVKCRLRVKPSHIDKENARFVLVQTRRFDRANVERMQKLKDRHDICVLVSGVVHSFAIWAETGYPIEHLWQEGTVTPREILHTYVTMYACPAMILAAS